MVIRYGARRAWTTLGGPLGLLGPASTDLVRWPQNCCDDTKAVVLGTILAAPSIEFQLALNIDTSPTNELGRQGFGLGSERGDSNPNGRRTVGAWAIIERDGERQHGHRAVLHLAKLGVSTEPP